MIKKNNLLHKCQIIGLAITLTLSLFNYSYAAKRGGGIAILRDAEIEHTLRRMIDPLLKAAGLDKNSVKVYLVNDSTLNAFVAGGQNIFINSGLLIQAKNANQVIGVVAHEIGHITGAHLSRYAEGMKGATTMTLLGAILGAAAIAAGAGDAGMALILGGQQIGRRTALKYSRTQESEADQAAVTILDKSHQSGEGLLDFLNYLGDQDLMSGRYQDPYASTHPVTTDRIARLRQRVDKSPYFKAKTPTAIENAFKRLQAKLYGYLKPPYATFNKYDKNDHSLYARYARTFAYHKQNKMKKALNEIDILLKNHPDDPYFWETKGQILFENGKVKASIAPYRNAVKYLPGEPLIRVSLAQSLISAEDNKYLKEALKNLDFALSRDPDNAFAWYQASIAYHRQHNKAMTYYATAERFLLIGNLRGAMVNAKHAVDTLPKNTPRWLRAQDILVITRSNMPEKFKKKHPDKS
ncbi:MAG: M48 family metallopeptidase [Alphaproteobacteria bacterium]|nr:M48 family metallopeptidase [Alphaproteobacteria bacterium]